MRFEYVLLLLGVGMILTYWITSRRRHLGVPAAAGAPLPPPAPAAGGERPGMTVPSWVWAVMLALVAVAAVVVFVVIPSGFGKKTYLAMYWVGVLAISALLAYVLSGRSRNFVSAAVGCILALLYGWYGVVLYEKDWDPKSANIAFLDSLNPFSSSGSPTAGQSVSRGTTALCDGESRIYTAAEMPLKIPVVPSKKPNEVLICGSKSFGVIRGVVTVLYNGGGSEDVPARGLLTIDATPVAYVAKTPDAMITVKVFSDR